MRLPRWAIPLPAIVLSFFPISAKAEPIAGLNAIGYSVSAIPPIKSDTQYPSCGQEIENNINRSFDGEPFQQCPNDNFMVHYTGFITIPENQTISFMVAADDGGTVRIGETPEFGTWNLKGCQWSAMTNFVLPAGQYPLNGWHFEAGGYACYMLAWSINGAGFVIVPDDAFTTNGVSSTTTTTSVTSTSTSTTTTSTTSSTSTTTTVLEPSTTTTLFATTSIAPLVQETSTTTSTTQLLTTTTPTTTDQTVATTVYVAPVTIPPAQPVETAIVVVPTGTIAQIEEVRPIETTLPVPVLTSVPKTDVPLTTETQPPQTVPLANETVAPPTSINGLPVLRPSTTATTLIVLEQISSPESAPPTSLPIQQENLPNISTPIEQDSLFDTVAGKNNLATQEEVDVVIEVLVDSKKINDEVFAEILNILSTPEVRPEAVIQVVGALLNTNLNQEQIVSLVSNAQVLENVTATQAEQIFTEVTESELSDEEGQQIVEAIQSVPKEIRQVFEQKIDVFTGVFDSYVPVGSLVPIGTRRTLVAVGAVLAMLPVPNLTKLTKV